MKVVDVRGQHVRIGIEAPDGVSIVREEIHRQVAAANIESARGQGVPEAIAGLASLLRQQEDVDGGETSENSQEDL
ncbi:MAG: carbon storage regulator [Acidobacteriota bacterium]|nr:carbon storage regulator [Acidobacteriota bacterium]MDQ7088982.1 carbon storage regulator [Acidobacteriota bacterium]